MQQPAFRIYLTANLAIFFVLSLFLFPEGIAMGVIAFSFSALSSVPSLLLLTACFHLIAHLKPGLGCSWLLLILSVIGGGSLPLLLLSIVDDSALKEDPVFLLSFGSAFAGTALQAFYINRYFKTIHHDSE